MYAEEEITITNTTFADTRLQCEYEMINDLMTLSADKLTLAGIVNFDNIHCANCIIYLKKVQLILSVLQNSQIFMQLHY